MKNIEDVKPAPDHYHPKTTLEDKLISKIQKGYKGNFGSTDRRFKIQRNDVELPGPGTYID